MSDPGEALRDIARALRAHLEVEAELGGAGLPAGQRPTRARDEGTHPPEDEPAPGANAATEVTDPQERVRRLQVMAREAAECTDCGLHAKRKRNVFARGNPLADLAFVGEGPGAEEDRQGLPFVGPAGQLLDRMIVAMGFERDGVYVCNVAKCRPPENRTPRAEEAIACARFLVPQLELVAPRVIVALGRCAAEHLGVAEASGPWRGRWGAWRGIPVMPTYHPAFLLRSPQFKRTVWEDLQKVMQRFGKAPPPRRAG